METGYVSSGSAQIYYETRGAGRPVVFLHAGIADSRIWRSQLDALGDTYRVVAFDQRGFGRTKWIPETYADRRDVLAVLDRHRFGRDSRVFPGWWSRPSHRSGLAREHRWAGSDWSSLMWLGARRRLAGFTAMGSSRRSLGSRRLRKSPGVGRPDLGGRSRPDD